MPSASDADRERYRSRFGDIDASHGVSALEVRGYKLTKDFDWVAPVGMDPSYDDLFLVAFLCQEWDFGWLQPLAMIVHSWPD